MRWWRRGGWVRRGGAGKRDQAGAGGASSDGQEEERVLSRYKDRRGREEDGEKGLAGMEESEWEGRTSGCDGRLGV